MDADSAADRAYVVIAVDEIPRLRTTHRNERVLQMCSNAHMKLAAAFLALSTFVFAADAPGPAIGAKVPNFQLTDQHGQTHGLKDLMGRKGLMLVFFRSADW